MGRSATLVGGGGIGGGRPKEGKRGRLVRAHPQGLVCVGHDCSDGPGATMAVRFAVARAQRLVAHDHVPKRVIRKQRRRGGGVDETRGRGLPVAEEGRHERVLIHRAGHLGTGPRALSEHTLSHVLFSNNQNGVLNRPF